MERPAGALSPVPLASSDAPCRRVLRLRARRLRARRLRARRLRVLGCCLLALWLYACHDSSRTNPVDPVRAPKWAVALLPPAAHSDSGAVELTWTRYRGPAFTAYRVVRREFQREPEVLVSGLAELDTVYWDRNARPYTSYAYSVVTALEGGDLESNEEELTYELPTISLTGLEMSSETATARIEWSPYSGPAFTAYEVRRADEVGRITVYELQGDATRTAYTDSLLAGNTEYSYQVAVRTEWGADVTVLSGTLSDRFHGLEETIDLPGPQNMDLNSVDIAIDEMAELWVAATLISSTSSRQVQPGVRVWSPSALGYYRTFLDAVPASRSPVRLAVTGGSLYVAVADTGGQLVVGAIDLDGPQLTWSARLQMAGGAPVGVHESDGELVVADDLGMLYVLDTADGGMVREVDRMALTVAEATPLQEALCVHGYGRGTTPTDEWILLAPLRHEHRVFGVSQVTDVIFGRGPAYDDGVGTGNGQVINPLCLAHDRERDRIYVVEGHGVLRVLRGGAEVQGTRYITQWGSFGSSPGQFQVSPVTAVAIAVDSRGKVYVADGANGDGRVQVFAP